MVIVNQDRDDIFLLKDKWLFKSKIYVRVQYFNGQLMGWNIYGKAFNRKEVLLGTYDEEDAKQIVDEIKNLLKARVENYLMPESALDLEDMLEEDIYD